MLVGAYSAHIRSSAGGGFISALLSGVIGKGKALTGEQEALIARLLSGAGTVSAELVVELEALIALLAREPESEPRFARVPPAAALDWLTDEAPSPLRAAFHRFLERHGHRGFRELAIEAPAWIDDLLPLISSMQPMLLARLQGGGTRGPREPAPAASASPGSLSQEAPGLALRGLIRLTQSGVTRREQTKSMLVDVTHRFKRAYRALGAQLAAEGLLPEAELVLYLTHEELGRLALTHEAGLAARAESRRRAHQVQATLAFDEVCVGRPLPLEPSPLELDASEGLVGQPVSPGVVEGPARVVRTLEEATALQPGEILITPLTDVAWTPYYSLIGGLATDLGSPFSHGAVVAREYGLPSVANLRSATRTFRTGERVRLDGDRGVLRRVDPEPAPAPEPPRAVDPAPGPTAHLEPRGRGEEASPC